MPAWMNERTKRASESMDCFSVFSHFSPIPPLSFAPPPMPQPQIIKNQRPKNDLNDQPSNSPSSSYQSRSEATTEAHHGRGFVFFPFRGNFPFSCFFLFLSGLPYLDPAEWKTESYVHDQARPYMLLTSQHWRGCQVITNSLKNGCGDERCPRLWSSRSFYREEHE